MKILFLARRFYPDIGGVEKHVLEVGRRLVKDGHKVTVITESSGKENSVSGIEIRRIKTKSKKLGIWSWFWENKDLIKDADIVHAHDVYFWYFPFRFLFPRKRSFVTFHGYESYPIRKRAILIRKITEKLSDGNIIVGDFIKKWYGTRPDFVIYGGVDLPKVNKPVQNRLSALFIGRLDEQTSVLGYAKAADIIKQRYPDFELKIYGDGKFKSELRRYHPKGFVGDVEKVLLNSSFAFVSRYLSILEALANKRLVFALYDNPVKEDYLKMSPFWKYIIITNNPNDLANKIMNYLENKKEADGIIKNAYAWTKNQTWENVANKYLKLWRP